MTEPESPRPRRKWIAFGELIALAALIISGLGLWNSWRGNESAKTGPTEVVERKSAVPLVLRGRIADEGKRLEIAPVEPGHALQSLTLKLANGQSIDVGSDGELDADRLEAAAEAQNPKRRGDGWIKATISARYVEAGVERTSSRTYAIGYRWDGGLFGGKSLRLTGFRSA